MGAIFVIFRTCLYTPEYQGFTTKSTSWNVGIGRGGKRIVRKSKKGGVNMLNWSNILPPQQNDYKGHTLAFYFLILIGLKDIFRSCVHYFAPDGGSGIIAGIPLETYAEGARMTIINSFAVYGVGQLVQAAILWIVIIRFRVWIPLIYLLSIISQILAIALFEFKPLPVVPPGQIGVYFLLPLTILFFLLSINTSEAKG